MKLAFFSNFLNHHQLPLCLEFYNNYLKQRNFTYLCDSGKSERFYFILYFAVYIFFFQPVFLWLSVKVNFLFWQLL